MVSLNGASGNEARAGSEADSAISRTNPETATDRVCARHTAANALGKAGSGDVFVLSHEAAERAVTESRREILDVLATKAVGSQAELARRLDRDPGNVGRDIDVLVDEGVVTWIQNGRAKKPVLTHDTYVVEPLVGTMPETVQE